MGCYCLGSPGPYVFVWVMLASRVISVTYAERPGQGAVVQADVKDREVT